MSPAWIGVICSASAVLLTLSTLIGKKIYRVARWLFGLFLRHDQFLEDFNGTPDRPGVPGRRGVMERLATIEAELSYNSGSTVKDAVRRIDMNVKTMASTSQEPQVQVNVHK